VPIASDGDERNFCSTCSFAAACLPGGYDKTALRELHVLIEHVGPYHAGEHLFRDGDPFNAIAAVRSGSLKTYVVDLEGREQVLGFFLPGEVIGLNGISRARYPCNAIALEDVMLCRFSFPKIATLATRVPDLQRQLFRLLSEDIGKATALTGDLSAVERFAAFLILLARRYAARGFSATRLRLSMSRTDIANYLRLTPATVSRLLRQFQNDGLVSVAGRDIELQNRARVEALARGALHD